MCGPRSVDGSVRSLVVQATAMSTTRPLVVGEFRGTSECQAASVSCALVEVDEVAFDLGLHALLLIAHALL